MKQHQHHYNHLCLIDSGFLNWASSRQQGFFANAWHPVCHHVPYSCKGNKTKGQNDKSHAI